MSLNTDVSERISEMIEKLDLSKNELGKRLGYQRSQSVYDICAGKALPSFDFFHRLLSSEFSEKINIEYLITGKGELFKRTPENIPADCDSNSLDMIRELSEKVGELKYRLSKYEPL